MESHLASSLSKVFDLCWVNKPFFYPSELLFMPQLQYRSATTHPSSSCLLFVEMSHLFRGCLAANPPHVAGWTISSVNLAKQSGLEPDVLLALPVSGFQPVFSPVTWLVHIADRRGSHLIPVLPVLRFLPLPRGTAQEDFSAQLMHDIKVPKKDF